MLFRQPSNATLSAASVLPAIKSHGKKPSVDSMKESKSSHASSKSPIIQKSWAACEKMVLDLTTYLLNESLYFTMFKMDRMGMKREGRIAQFVLYDLKDYQTMLQNLSTLSEPSAKNEKEALKAIANIKKLYLSWQNHIKELRAFDFALYTWMNDTTDADTLKKLSQLIKNINKWQSDSEREKELKEWTETSIRHSQVQRSKLLKSEKSSQENSQLGQDERPSEKPLTMIQQLISQIYTWMDNPDNKIELEKLKKLINKSLTKHEGIEAECRFKKSTFDSADKLLPLLTDAIKECEVILFNAKNMSSTPVSLPKLKS